MGGKWTPGPWFYEIRELYAPTDIHGEGKFKYVGDVYAANGHIICRFDSRNKSVNADAVLIASAPEMAERIAELEAVAQRLLDSLCTHWHSCPLCWGPLILTDYEHTYEHTELCPITLARQALAGAEGDNDGR